MSLSTPVRSARFTLLARAFAPPGDDADGTVRLREYQRLFVGLSRPAVYPYESCYREPDGQLAGPWMAQVAALYANEGLTPTGLLPDHIVAELAFMAHLTACQAEAETRGDEASAQGYREKQVAFLRDHLVRWVPTFCEQVLAHTDDPFYTAAARLLQDVLTAEVEHSVPGSGGAGEPRSRGAEEQSPPHLCTSAPRPKWWSLVIDPDRCILCGVCADVCQPGALVLKRSRGVGEQGRGGDTERGRRGDVSVSPRLRVSASPDRWSLVLDPERCTGCDACRRICPTRAICNVVLSAKGMAVQALVESPVVACRGCGTPLMPQANLIYLEHRLRRQRTELLAHLALCPRCRLSGIST